MKYSKYYKTLIIMATITAMIGLMSTRQESPTITALLFTIAFILWYVSIMAPSYEKYEQVNNFPARKSTEPFKKRKL